MSDKNKCSSSKVCGCGSSWLIGWLFTIGLIKATFWKGVLAILIWPYFLGSFLTDKFFTQLN